MPCEEIGGAIVCRPMQINVRRVYRCPTCKQRRRIVGWVAYWYDTVWTCCTCGDSWSGHEMLPRPFKPAWREESARKAREAWALGVNRTEAMEWLKVEAEAYR